MKASHVLLLLALELCAAQLDESMEIIEKLEEARGELPRCQNCGKPCDKSVCDWCGYVQR